MSTILEEVISRGENELYEFKRYTNDYQSIVIKSVVAMTNSKGGSILIGVEDNGLASGIPNSDEDLNKLVYYIRNHTKPSIQVKTSIRSLKHKDIIEIIVNKGSGEVFTDNKDNAYCRCLKSNGDPENRKMTIQEISARKAFFGKYDYSSQTIEGIRRSSLDNIERERLRTYIKSTGNRDFARLSNDEFDEKLGLAKREGRNLHVTVTGLLFLGNCQLLTSHLSNHEFALQDEVDGDLVTNRFLREPLGKIVEFTDTYFESKSRTTDIPVGLFRVNIPNYDKLSFREAFLNSLIHRDYSKQGTTSVQFKNDGIVIKNPGGFVDGVNINNLLSVGSRPRNPALADAFRVLGLAERYGRGIPRIFAGLVRYGRPLPDYSATRDDEVVIELSNAESDLPLLRLIAAEENKSGEMDSSSLIVLSSLRKYGPLSEDSLMAEIQGTLSGIKHTLKELCDKKLINRDGTRKPTYHLAISTLDSLSRIAQEENPLNYEDQIVNLIRKHGYVTRKLVMMHLELDGNAAFRLLNGLHRKGVITKSGVKKGTKYFVP